MKDLFKDIVPARAMGIEVASFKSGKIRLSAPLDKNLNDKGTGFAGSIASMLSLAGWGAITASLQEQGIAADVMVVKSEIKYSAAVRSDLSAEAGLSADEMERVFRELKARGRSRLCVSASVCAGGIECATMVAHYALVK